MSTHRVCVDFGYTGNLAIVAVDLTTNKMIYGECFSMIRLSTLEGEKRSHAKKRDFRRTILQRVTIALKVAAGVIAQETRGQANPPRIEIVPEAQFCENRGRKVANGRDLVWLEAALTAISHSMDWEVRDPIRNCDACKKFGITAAKKEISTTLKKKETIRVVNEKMGLKLVNEHLADALLIHLAC